MVMPEVSLPNPGSAGNGPGMSGGQRRFFSKMPTRIMQKASSRTTNTDTGYSEANDIVPSSTYDNASAQNAIAKRRNSRSRDCCQKRRKNTPAITQPIATAQYRARSSDFGPVTIRRFFAAAYLQQAARGERLQIAARRRVLHTEVRDHFANRP